MSEQPIGEIPDIDPRPEWTIVAALQDVTTILLENSKLKDDNAWLRRQSAAFQQLREENNKLAAQCVLLRGQRDEARGERDEAKAIAASGRMAP